MAQSFHHLCHFLRLQLPHFVAEARTEPPSYTLINHRFQAHGPQSHSFFFSAASVLQTFLLNTKLNAGSLHANKVIWGMFRAIYIYIEMYEEKTRGNRRRGLINLTKMLRKHFTISTPEYTQSFIHLAPDV